MLRSVWMLEMNTELLRFPLHNGLFEIRFPLLRLVHLDDFCQQLAFHTLSTNVVRNIHFAIRRRNCSIQVKPENEVL
ncbi:hypothetical protein D3C84_927980 [compost metagenome]